MGDLNGVELFYWVAFLFGFVYAVIGFFSHGFGGGDVDVDHGAVVDHDWDADASGLDHDLAANAAHGAGVSAVHVSPFNSLTIAAFSVSLGAIGLIGLRYLGLGAWQSLGFSFLGALALAAGFFLSIVRPLYRSQSTSLPDINELVRAPAQVRTAIPAAGVGEVVYVAGATRFTMPARSAEETAIASGTRVAILHIRKGVADVVPLGLEEEYSLSDVDKV
jgi:hypothetical protein